MPRFGVRSSPRAERRSAGAPGRGRHDIPGKCYLTGDARHPVHPPERRSGEGCDPQQAPRFELGRAARGRQGTSRVDDAPRAEACAQERALGADPQGEQGRTAQARRRGEASPQRHRAARAQARRGAAPLPGPDAARAEHPAPRGARRRRRRGQRGGQARRRAAQVRLRPQRSCRADGRSRARRMGRPPPLRWRAVVRPGRRRRAPRDGRPAPRGGHAHRFGA